MSAVKLTCAFCKKEFERLKKNIKKDIEKFFCNRKCQSQQQRIDNSDEYSPFKPQYNNIIYDCKRTGKECDIELNDMKEKFEDQEGKCKLSGVPIYFGNTLSERRHGGTTASFDRIDNTKGYLKDNTQWLHQKVNRQYKRDDEEDEYIWWCRQVVEATKDRVIVFKPEWLRKFKEYDLTGSAAPCYNGDATTGVPF